VGSRRHWHAHLYPKDMRKRYLSEIEALTEELRSDPTFRRRSLVLDLVVSASRARVRQQSTNRWLVGAFAGFALTAGLLLATRTTPPSTSPPATSSQQRINGVPPKQCMHQQDTNSSGYLCEVVLNPRTGATESATMVPLTDQQSHCLRRQEARQPGVTCLPMWR
jgi:hypothetical protein